MIASGLLVQTSLGLAASEHRKRRKRKDRKQRGKSPTADPGKDQEIEINTRSKGSECNRDKLYQFQPDVDSNSSKFFPVVGPNHSKSCQASKNAHTETLSGFEEKQKNLPLKKRRKVLNSGSSEPEKNPTENVVETQSAQSAQPSPAHVTRPYDATGEQEETAAGEVKENPSEEALDASNEQRARNRDESEAEQREKLIGCDSSVGTSHSEQTTCRDKDRRESSGVTCRKLCSLEENEVCQKRKQTDNEIDKRAATAHANCHKCTVGIGKKTTTRGFLSNHPHHNNGWVLVPIGETNDFYAAEQFPRTGWVGFSEFYQGLCHLPEGRNFDFPNSPLSIPSPQACRSPTVPPQTFYAGGSTTFFADRSFAVSAAGPDMNQGQ